MSVLRPQLTTPRASDTNDRVLSNMFSHFGYLGERAIKGNDTIKITPNSLNMRRLFGQVVYAAQLSIFGNVHL